MQERYDRGGAERGQHNKQGRMEEEANQLYRLLWMMGQARDEGEGEVYINIYCLLYTNVYSPDGPEGNYFVT